MTAPDQDHALVVYADSGIHLPRETLEAIGPRGVLIVPLSLRPIGQVLTADPQRRCVVTSPDRGGARCALIHQHGGEHSYAADPWAEGTGDGYSVPHLRAGLEGIRDLTAQAGTGSIPTPVLTGWCDTILAGEVIQL